MKLNRTQPLAHTLWPWVVLVTKVEVELTCEGGNPFPVRHAKNLERTFWKEWTHITQECVASVFWELYELPNQPGCPGFVHRLRQRTSLSNKILHWLF